MRLLAVGLIFLVAACATPTQTVWHLHGATVFTDNPVVLGPLEEFVVPQNEADAPERALMFPMALEGDAARRREVGVGLSARLVEVWRGMGVFSALELDTETRVMSRAQALALAQSRGANVLLWGHLAPVFLGGGLGRTEIGVRLEAIWVATGQTYWAAAQAGVLEGGPVQDYVLARQQPRLPRYPEATVMAALAESLGRAYLAHGGGLR